MKNNFLFNEFWSWSKGPLFKNYYFSDDGSFIHDIRSMTADEDAKEKQIKIFTPADRVVKP